MCGIAETMKRAQCRAEMRGVELGDEQGSITKMKKQKLGTYFVSSPPHLKLRAHLHTLGSLSIVHTRHPSIRAPC